jgi:antitoxin (DNA-binding transcriptional repressor) of toxin-antitoxin stability system
MRVISVDEFGANWPRLLSQLEAGEEFLLTDAGRPVGRVLPPSPPPAQPSLTPAEWERELRDWQREVRARADRYPPGFAVDCSYQAIYGEREDVPR